VFLDMPGGRFWNDWLVYIRTNLLDGGMISPEDLSLFRVTDCVEDTVAEILRFYHVFHSMEYLHHRLVIRLQQPIPEARLAKLERDFADILTDGHFRQETSVEADSLRPELAALPRLVLHFNRRSLGRLRQLIDSINADLA
jgi:hypothetical protein